MDRNQALIRFYEICVEKNYTDMGNDEQRLDAKVVAADLQIKHKDIGELFEEAKRVSERTMVDGQLLVSIMDKKNDLKVFLRSDNTIYSVINAGDKIEGAPKITVNKGGSISYTYNPSQAIFTSVTVGGITTGGVECTKASYSEKVVDSGKGYIEVSIGGKAFAVHIISFSPFIRERFKRNASFQRIAGVTGNISCRKSNIYTNRLLAESLLGADYKQQMTMLSQAADDERLPYSQCVEIANLLGQVVNLDFPPLDEDVYGRAVTLMKSSDPMLKTQADKLLLTILDYKDSADLIYTRAVELSTSKTSPELHHAMELFSSVSHCKDTESHIDVLKAKIETAIHEEKKATLLRKESQAKRRKKMVLIGSIAIVVIAIVSFIFSTAVMPIIHYKNAEKLLADANYLGALAQFDAAGEYRDAQEQSIKLWDNVGRTSSLVAGSYFTVGLKSDGTLLATGSNQYGQCDVFTWTDITAIAAGYYHTAGLKSDGTVVAVGNTSDGQCDVSKWKNIVAIACSLNHTVGLKTDGTVVATGYNLYGQCDVDEWTDIVAITASGAHTVGLKSNGTVLLIGKVKEGARNVSQWSDIVAIADCALHTVGLKSNGTVVAIGDNSQGQCNVSSWKDIVAIAANGEHTVGLKSDGTVVATGLNTDGQCDVSQWTDIVAITAGDDHTIGLKADGTVVSTGDNYYGQCDVTNWTNIKLPN